MEQALEVEGRVLRCGDHYICLRCNIAMRRIGGSTKSSSSGRITYTGVVVCELCGRTAVFTFDMTKGEDYAIASATAKILRVTMDGEVRAHIANAMTGELLACHWDGGFLYEKPMADGRIGHFCPRCIKFRSGDETRWIKHPAVVISEGKK